MDDVETFSNDSSRLTLSGSRLPSLSRPSRSIGYVDTKLDREPGVVGSVPPSDDSDTDWNEEMEEAWVCPPPAPREGIEMPILPWGGYE